RGWFSLKLCAVGAARSVHRTDEKERIEPRIAPFERPMQMRSRRPTGRADVANVLAAPHRFAFAHDKPRGTQEGAAQPAPMIDDEEQAFERERILGRQHDDAVGRRDVRRAVSSGDIEARMIAPRLAAAVDALRAETARYATLCRPGERLPPAGDVVVL